MAFDGFTREDFAVFDIEGFEHRMPALKQRITPKLKELAATLAPVLEESLCEELFPHVAQHLRRSVNAPNETWAAFSPSRRAYKPFVHYRVGISAERVRVVVFVEDYATEKAAFANHLAGHASELCAKLQPVPRLVAFTLEDADGGPLPACVWTPERLAAFGERMARVKGQHAVFGVSIPAADPVLATGPAAVARFVEIATALHPLYACRTTP